MGNQGQRVRKAERSAMPDTPDAIDVAMGMVGDERVARTLLEKHCKLIEAQIQSERLEHGVKRALIAFRSARSASISVFSERTSPSSDSRSSRSSVTALSAIAFSTAARFALMKSSPSMGAAMRELRGKGKFA